MNRARRAGASPMRIPMNLWKSRKVQASSGDTTNPPALRTKMSHQNNDESDLVAVAEDVAVDENRTIVALRAARQRGAMRNGRPGLPATNPQKLMMNSTMNR